MADPKAIRITSVHGLGRAELRALGTGVVVLTSDPRQIAAATLEVRRELADLDAACTARFRPDSNSPWPTARAVIRSPLAPLLAEAVRRRPCGPPTSPTGPSIRRLARPCGSSVTTATLL